MGGLDLREILARGAGLDIGTGMLDIGFLEQSVAVCRGQRRDERIEPVGQFPRRDFICMPGWTMLPQGPAIIIVIERADGCGSQQPGQQQTDFHRCCTASLRPSPT